jgi:hypothetical protein
MALANKAVNVTKYDAGGSGDNIIPDGFIKSVEKVWIDTYVFSTSATIGTGMVIDIAKIPVGKKITGIEVYGLAAAQISATSTNAVSIGARYVNAVTNATQFLGATTLGTVTFDNNPIIARSNIGVEVTGSTHTIFLHFTAASPSITGGTITTKVRYT